MSVKTYNSNKNITNYHKNVTPWSLNIGLKNMTTLKERNEKELLLSLLNVSSNENVILENIYNDIERYFRYFLELKLTLR